MAGKDKRKDKKLEIRTKRIFSEEFKRQKVKLLIEKKVSIKELSALYELSRTTVYRWLYRYSPHHNQGSIQVVQMSSEEAKNLSLLKRVAELERIIGQKQLEIDFLDKMICIASENLRVDIKKNFDTRPSNGFVKESKNKPSK